MNEIPEKDWKYLRSIKGEMLEVLCQRINEEALSIVNDASSTQHERFLRLFQHLREKNRIVGNCFDDWRRSHIMTNLLWLQSQKLITTEHLSRLSAETRERLALLSSAELLS